jgi:hypothetical protein
MIKEKEGLLNQYLEDTKAMLKAVTQGKEQDFFQLLENRQDAIAAINKLDEAAGSCLKNEQIDSLLQAAATLEQAISKGLQPLLAKMSRQIRSVQNEKFLSKQYEEAIPVSKGVFYDEKK